MSHVFARDAPAVRTRVVQRRARGGEEAAWVRPAAPAPTPHPTPHPVCYPACPPQVLLDSVPGIDGYMAEDSTLEAAHSVPTPLTPAVPTPGTISDD